MNRTQARRQRGVARRKAVHLASAIPGWLAGTAVDILSG